MTLAESTAAPVFMLLVVKSQYTSCPTPKQHCPGLVVWILTRSYYFFTTKPIARCLFYYFNKARKLAYSIVDYQYISKTPSNSGGGVSIGYQTVGVPQHQTNYTSYVLTSEKDLIIKLCWARNRVYRRADFVSKIP
jgi:hypothetical protein